MSVLKPAVIARAGNVIYRVPFGVPMLAANFPRILGDMFNAAARPLPLLCYSEFYRE
jgi:hypothetical protein